MDGWNSSELIICGKKGYAFQRIQQANQSNKETYEQANLPSTCFFQESTWPRYQLHSHTFTETRTFGPFSLHAPNLEFRVFRSGQVDCHVGHVVQVRRWSYSTPEGVVYCSRTKTTLTVISPHLAGLVLHAANP